VYCDFYSIESVDMMESFLEALLCEIATAGLSFGAPLYDTVYFGGGTPSLMTPAQVRSVVAQLCSSFRVADDAEVTLEVNPGTVTFETLAAFRAAGVNRLSIGIQSFHDRELAFLGRIHDRRAAFRAVEDARRAGFGNISVDLIYSLPGQSAASWEETLQSAAGFHPEHISAYSLIVEEGTPLAGMVRKGIVTPNPAEEEAGLYQWTMHVLAERGYEHYEVSNYALPGKRSRHNSRYWDHSRYLGFGPSAHSFWMDETGVSAKRWWNVSNVQDYCTRVRNGNGAKASGEELGRRQLADEHLMLGLRSTGIRTAMLESFGFPLTGDQQEILRGLEEQGLVKCAPGLIGLTQAGFPLCDEIVRRLLIP
jgi:oxygen-independent coproporphyrinogen-3 oxidase